MKPLRREVRRAPLPRAQEARAAALVSLDAQAAALRELRRSLSRSPREIPCKYLYDDAGSRLFEQITRLAEYFPTRTEQALLDARATAIVAAAGGPALALPKGEGIRTEISRRFTRDGALRLLDAAGFTPGRWMESPDGRFGLALGAARASLRGLR